MAEYINNPKQLESTYGNKVDFIQHYDSADTEKVGDKFGNGRMKWKLDVGSNERLQINKAYFTMRAKLSVTAGTTQLATSADVAFAMNCAAACFNSAEFRSIKPLKSIDSLNQYVAQLHTLQTRMGNSRAQLNGGIRDSELIMNPDFVVRRAITASDGIAWDKPNAVHGNKEEWGHAITTTISYANATDICTFSAAGDLLVAGDILWIGGTHAVIDTVTSTTVITLVATCAFCELIGASDLTATLDFSFPKKSERIQEYEFIYTPPLGIFKIKEDLPMGSYELDLEPYSDGQYQKSACDTSIAAKVSGTDFKFEVTDLKFNYTTYTAPRLPENMNAYFDLDKMEVYRDTVSKSTSETTKITVSKRIFGISVFYQDADSLASTLYSNTKFVERTNQQNFLSKFYVKYDGKMYPPTVLNNSYKNGSTAAKSLSNFFLQKYRDTMKGINALYDEGSPESFEDWMKRGFYIYSEISVDGQKDPSKLEVTQEFTNGSVGNIDIFVVVHYRDVLRYNKRGDNITWTDSKFNVPKKVGL